MIARLRRLLPDTPLLPAFLTLLIALCIASVYAQKFSFNLSAFVQAGTPLSNAAVLGPNFVVRPDSPGHDSQFYYRLSVQPWTTQRTAHGVTLDNPPYRHQRIFYSLVVWCLSFGRAAWVPTIMLSVNIVALTMIGALGGLWARRLNRHAFWGLLLPLHLGFAFSLCMDLTEILQMCLALAALLAWTQRRFWPAGLLLALSVLTKETSLLFAVAGVLVYGWERFRRIEAGQRTTAPVVFVLPLVAYVSWQIVLRQIWGQWPLLAGEHNLGLPFVGAARSIAQTLQSRDSSNAGLSLLTLIEVWVILMLTATAAMQLRTTPLQRPIVVSWALYALLGACLSRVVLSVDANFQRGLSELIVLCFILILARSTARLRWSVLCLQIALVAMRIYIVSVSR